jgi:uncharacterized protein YgiM (DUF1202 family)
MQNGRSFSLVFRASSCNSHQSQTPDGFFLATIKKKEQLFAWCCASWKFDWAGRVVWGEKCPFQQGTNGWKQSHGTHRATGKLCARNLDDTPSRDETLAIKISTTTPVLHQKTRQTGFAWLLE